MKQQAAAQCEILQNLTNQLLRRANGHPGPRTLHSRARWPGCRRPSGG
jgi:hypothetical protein